MSDYERACDCCSWRFAPDKDERFCGPCGRERGLASHPRFAYAEKVDEDWRKASGHVCPLLWTSEEQRLAEAASARIERELR